jgi:hypothetical protein
VFTAVNSWFIKSNRNTYTYYSLSKRTIEWIFNYEDKDILLNEWITLDSQEIQILRIVQNLADALSKVGGLQHITVLVFSYFLVPYALFNFEIDAYNLFFKFHSKDDKYVTEDGKLKLTWWHKLKLIFLGNNYYNDDKLQRLM